MPLVAGVLVAGVGVPIGLGSCEISTVEPEGTNLAGSFPVALLVASLTGMPLSRSCPDAAVVGVAALAVGFVAAT